MPRWTPEARAKQAQRIREWQPWRESTGPVTRRGKRRSAANWSKGARGSILKLTRLFRSIVRGE